MDFIANDVRAQGRAGWDAADPLLCPWRAEEGGGTGSLQLLTWVLLEDIFTPQRNKSGTECPS